MDKPDIARAFIARIPRPAARTPSTAPDPGRANPRKSPSKVVNNLQSPAVRAPALPEELGGPSGPEPTRFGDWERNGRCSDF